MSKELRLVTDETSALIRIEYEGGGEVPAMLQGLYTDALAAKRDIAVYADGKGREIGVVDRTQQTVEESKTGKRMSRPDAQALG